MSFLRLPLKFFAPGFNVSWLSIRRCYVAWIRQKLFRINAGAHWPVHASTKIQGAKKIDRGDRCPGLSRGCHLDGRNGITFGKNVWVGPYVSIISMNHDLQDYTKYVKADPITIGDNCWIGAHAIILPGVTLGPHTVVAAGAVVTKSFPEGNCVIGGNTAKVIKALEPYGA